MFFMILPVGVDYRTDRLPVVTFSLMGLCVLIHLWSMILWRMGIQSSADEIGQHLTEGAIVPDAFFWCAGMTEWRPVAEYPQPLAAGRAGG